MQLRDQYDWVVLGDDPGALLSAGLVARLGLSVLVVPAGQPSRLSEISKGGQAIDPETNFLLGLSRASIHPGLLAEGLGKLGILAAEEELIQSQECLPQIVTPEFRIELAPEFEGIEAVFRREMGASTADRLGLLQAYRASERDLLRYLNELPDRLSLSADGKLKGRSSAPGDFRRQLSQSRSLPRRSGGKAATLWLDRSKPFSEVIRETDSFSSMTALRGIWNAVIGTPERDPAAAALLQALIVAKTGASFRGGRTAYREFLARVAKRQGAHFPEEGACQRIFIDNGRLSGIQLENKGQMITARGGAIGCGTTKAESLMIRSGKAWFSRRQRGAAPTGWRFTLALTVHDEAIPPGIGTRLLWQEADAPGLEIEIGQPEDYGVKGGDQRLMFLRTILPLTEESFSQQSLRQVCARMLRQAKELIPFLEFHIIRIFPDFRTDAFERQLGEFYGARKPEGLPTNLLCFTGAGAGARGEADGLFVIGEESYPEMGSFGPSVAALEAVAWIAHRSGLPGPLA